MARTRGNHDIDSVRKEVRALHDELSRVTLLIEALQKEDTSAASSRQSPDKKELSAGRQPSLSYAVIPSTKNDNPSRKPFYKTLQGWNTVLQMIGIPFAILYAIITTVEWRDLKHNFEADERSWVKIQYAWPDDKEMAANYSSWPLQAKIGMWNIGKSAITSVTGEAAFEILDSKQSPSFSLKGFHSTDIVSPIFPTDESDFLIEMFDQTTFLPRSLTQEEYDVLRNGTKYLAIFGYIAYRDQFGVHWNQFCSWKSYSTSRVQVNAGPCVPFNKIGDGTDNFPFGKKYQP